MLVFALVLAVWSVCAVAADAQKADEAADETTAAEPCPQKNLSQRKLLRRLHPLPTKKRMQPPRTQKHPQKTANRTIFTL